MEGREGGEEGLNSNIPPGLRPMVRAYGGVPSPLASSRSPPRSARGQPPGLGMGGLSTSQPLSLMEGHSCGWEGSRRRNVFSFWGGTPDRDGLNLAGVGVG